VRFFVCFCLFRNLNMLLLSYDLLRLFSFGFNLGLLMFVQCLLGILLCWIYSNVFFLSFVSAYYTSLDFEVGYLVRSFHIVTTSFLYFCYMFIFIKFFICVCCLICLLLFGFLVLFCFFFWLLLLLLVMFCL